MTVKRFNTILIANRGEIACRVARTAHAMGYRTVAVYSAVDANAMHVRAATQAVALGGSTAAGGYLDIEAIVEAARRSHADAVHPGYGFLSENADFAAACESAGLVFIGPPPRVLRQMGNKAEAKLLVAKAGVPCVPGYIWDGESDEHLDGEAARIGYPLVIKAVAGGGGRGIRAVLAPADFRRELASARREAESSFGNGAVMLERLIERPRHLEVQVFGDTQGNVVHLFERDCTIQRRRQKIIEEAPSPVLTDEGREKLTSYAVSVARAAGYVNAGTVEFIADRDLNIFFLEMNTRLQVEHPVTEMIMGLDLVEWQLRVAAGEPLPLRQEEIAIRGHAIEARLCAEDPYDGFRPRTGRVAYFANDRENDVRIDTGVEVGSEVTPFYDSLVAKVIAHGRDRAEAIRRLARALENAPLLGLDTNQTFLTALIESEGFRRSRFSTETLDAPDGDDVATLFARPSPSAEVWALASALFLGRDHVAPRICLGIGLGDILDLVCGEDAKTLQAVRSDQATITTEVDGRPIAIRLIEVKPQRIVFEAAGQRRQAFAAWAVDTLYLSTGGCSFTFSEVQHQPREDTRSSGGEVRAPVAGLVTKVFAEIGEFVEGGQTLALVEAMKMETRVSTRARGRVLKARVQSGQQVSQGDILFELDENGV